ncbi:MAG: TonB-dependent siderophore receptor [Nostoc sp.]|uniref:TonB-dependent siderophore receptor n=1 Tax=Nostoc sp. TaxID=1180 RepID=UPI002FF75038
MVLKQILKIVLVTSCVWVWCAMSATASSLPKKEVIRESIASVLRNSRSIKQISTLSEIELPSTSARLLVQTPAPSNPPQQRGSVVPITGVKANPTAKGVEILLQTTAGTQLQVTNRSTGNNFIVDVSGGQLRLPSGDTYTFRSEKPLAGITQITVINLDANTVRVTVVGEKALPTVELYDDNAGLVFAVATTATATSPQQPPQAQPPQSQTQPTQPSASGDEPIELVVTGEQDGYRVTDGSTATKTDTPLRDIPQSIQVIPQQVIKDQQITRISDAVRNASGVTVQGGYAGHTDNYVIRGFSTYFDLRNGFAVPDNYSNYISPINVERVEVLKGPASVLYGQFEPGGVVNYITKQPLTTPYYSAEFTLGNYDYYRGAIDFSQPLTADKKVLSRLNIAYENSGSFIDFVNGESYSIAPVISLQLSDATNLTLEYEHNIVNRTFYDGLPPVRQSFEVPISRYLGEPNADSYNFQSDIATITLKHRFSDNFQFRSALLINNNSGDYNTVRAFSLLDDGRTLSRELAGSLDYFRGMSLQNELVSKFKTGSINHQLLLGLDFSWAHYVNDYLRTPAPNLDLFNPVYGAPLPTSFSDAENAKTDTNTVAVYLQDQVTLLPSLKLLVGGRFDFINENYKDIDLNNNNQLLSKDQFNDQAFSPRVGLVYQPIEPISLYASYAQSFNPNDSRTASGQALQPSSGTQYEVGIKTEWLNKQLSTTLAAYDITKTNVATTDPSNSDFSVATGEVKSRGIELDIAGKILPGWNVIASFAHNDAYVSKDNSIPVGNRLVNAPRYNASLWTSYEIQSGSFKGLGFGGGVFFVGDRQALLPNNGLIIPSYVRTDASIFYKKERWRVGLNFKNLLDTRYYDSQGYLLRPGAPLTVLGTISLEF